MEPLDDRELEALRQVMIAMSPGLQADVQAMTSIMREMVAIERKRLGLDHPGGKVFLEPYQKKNQDDPDLTGSAWVTGRHYQAAAWKTKDGKIKIGLYTPRKK